MKRPRIADFVQREDQPSNNRSPTIDSVLLQVQEIQELPKDVAPGYKTKNTPRSQNTSQKKQTPRESNLFHAQKRSSRLDYEFIDQKSGEITPQHVVSQFRQKHAEEVSFRKPQSRPSEMIRISRDGSLQNLFRKNNDISLFEIKCSYGSLKCRKVQYNICLLEEGHHENYATCYQDCDSFKYKIQEQVLYEMDYKLNCYSVREGQNDDQDYHSSRIYLTHVNEYMTSASKGPARSRNKCEVLMSYCIYENKKLSSRVKYYPKFKLPYTYSKLFNMDSVLPSILNTVIINSMGDELCAIYQKENKILVESRSQDIPTHIILLLAVSRIDFKRRCCVPPRDY